MKKKIKVVIYIRYSSHRQAGSFSVEYQLAECKKHIERSGYELVEVYIDEAKTGKKTAGREAFDSMMFDASLNKFDKIIVFSFSRSFRNTRDALNYNYELQEKYNIVIESVIERIDMTDPHGKFSGTNLFAMHELQSDITAAHVKSGMYFAAQQGYYLGGYVPFGYELYGTSEFSRGKERKKYRPHKEESSIVETLFKLYAEGFSFDYIQTQMRDLGVKGRKGDIIGKQTICRILKNPFYIGTREYKVKGYEPLSIEDSVPAIVDKELWNQVQARFANSETALRPRKTKRLYSLTGKITCAKCGGHMFGTYRMHRKGEKYSYCYYICSNKRNRKTCDAKDIRKDQLEEYCLDQIKRHILDEEAMRVIATQITEQAGTDTDDMRADLSKFEKRREKIAAILKNIKKEQYEGEITKEMAEEMSAEYQQELLDIENRLCGLRIAVTSAISAENVYLYLQELLSFYGSNNDELTKMLFDKLIDNIVVDDNRVELSLIVIPFDGVRGNASQGLPHWTLCTKTTKEEIKK